ncbi:hypothetical protein GQ53DRAFT_816626 [Thozetella sp. PMI_491]|nr:hypothetical protein GQ53DRAFT_816626 [Thozetella sp. PMI_491]
MPSRSGSVRSSPRPSSRRGRDDLSRPDSPARSPAVTQGNGASNSIPVRESKPTQGTDASSTAIKSPPRGPAALRAPPTGPSASRNFTPPNGPSRPDITSPTIPPAGPRGYVPSRGGSYPARGGRGGWPAIGTRVAPSVSPTIPQSGPSGIPTGPRAGTSSASGSGTVSPALGSKPFNPPTGPAAHNNQGPPPRQTLAQNLIANMPSIVAGGKADPAMSTVYTGVTKELEVHHRKLKEDEERIRDELKLKQDRLRKSLRLWDKLERESKGWELKSDLSGKSLQNIAGEGLGGAAF